MPRAAEIMKKDVITLRPEMSVEEAGRVFIEHNIGGAPVVDDAGNLYGIVTENDLIARDKRLHIPTILRIFDAYIALGSTSAMREELRKMAARTVKDIMTADVISVTEDTPLEELATIMTEKGVHLLPVVKGTRLVGVVGRHEVLKAAASE